MLGAVYFDKGDIAPAIANFQNCLKLDSDFEPAREKLIQAYEKTGQPAQAVRLLEPRVASLRGKRSLRELVTLPTIFFIAIQPLVVTQGRFI